MAEDKPAPKDDLRSEYKSEDRGKVNAGSTIVPI